MTVLDIQNFAKTFEDLEVFEKAYAASIEIHQTSKAFPKEEQFSFTSQIRRSSKSICANIAEGFVKQGQSSAKFGRFLSIAIGSAGEMLVWARYAKDLGYVDTETASRWRMEYESIVKMLQKLRNSLGN